jgi:hypothetical protein
MPATPIQEALANLHAHYVERVNMAVAEDRMDLVWDLADEYEDEALDLMLTLEGDTTSDSGYGPAESLQFGGLPTYRKPAGKGWLAGWRRRGR